MKMASNTGTSLTSFWLNFFTDAGIPAGEATNYAISFSDNRITQDMLMDLNKEILQDMGVTVMGDIIAILKHAKSAHAQSAREKLLKGSSATPPTARTATPPRRSTPASRTVNHYLGTDPEARPMNEPATKSSMSEEMANRLGPSPAQLERTDTPLSSSSETSDQSIEPSGPDTIGGLHETLSLGSTRPNISVKIPTGRRQKEEVPVPKVRRVFPEHEGKYKVTMPAGTTAKTRKILEEQGLAPTSKKSSVFERLGGESAGKCSNPKVTITGLGNIVINKPAESQATGVFNRLGTKRGIKRAAATSTTDDGLETSFEKPGALEYAGIFKMGRSPSKKAKADAQVSSVKKLSIEERLGPAKRPDSTTSAGIFAKAGDGPANMSTLVVPKRLAPAKPAPVKAKGKIVKLKLGTQKVEPPAKQDIKARLGTQKAEATSTSTQGKKKTITLNRKGGVFSRLGKHV